MDTIYVINLVYVDIMNVFIGFLMEL